MADTYSQIYIQVVFSVQNRKALIQESWEKELYKYITAIIQNKGQKLIAINGMPDHIHIFIGMKPNCCLSDLVREIKKNLVILLLTKSNLRRFRFIGRKDSVHFHTVLAK